MVIINERHAMTIFRLHPTSHIFDIAPVDISGMAVSVITLAMSFLTFPVWWLYTLNAASTATGPMPVR